jgi:hypothetical protein
MLNLLFINMNCGLQVSLARFFLQDVDCDHLPFIALLNSNSGANSQTPVETPSLVPKALRWVDRHLTQAGCKMVI